MCKQKYMQFHREIFFPNYSILPKLLCKSNIMPIKITMDLHMIFVKLMLKFMKKNAKPKTAKKILALAGVAQWTERWPANQRVAGLIPFGAHAWVAGQVPRRGT